MKSSEQLQLIIASLIDKHPEKFQQFLCQWTQENYILIFSEYSQEDYADDALLSAERALDVVFAERRRRYELRDPLEWKRKRRQSRTPHRHSRIEALSRHDMIMRTYRFPRIQF